MREQTKASACAPTPKPLPQTRTHLYAHTHTEIGNSGAFPRQQWFCERALEICYTYFAQVLPVAMFKRRYKFVQ